MLKKAYLLSPGPTPIPPEVSEAASRPLIHHRTPEFSKIFMEVTQGLQYMFQTERDVFVLTSSGSGAMEAAVVNILDPGDKVLVLNAGKFGNRWKEIAQAYGIQVREVKVAWGENYPKENLADQLIQHPDCRAVFTTLSETSTGTVYDIEGYARVVSQTPALLVVDGISGLGAMPCPMDQWNIDVLISGSQKSFMTPPGLAFLAFSQKAWEAVERSRLPRFYFDAQAAYKGLMKKTSAWTPAITLVRQLHKALQILQSIGLPELFTHHRILAEATRAGVHALDLSLLSQNPGNIVTAVRTPSGLDGTGLVKIMQNKYLAHIVGAQEPHKGEFFRIGHLGFIGGFDIITALAALEMTLEEMGYQLNKGDSLRAAQTIIKEHWQ
jgi:aspartate aminotransferase-like enzyme